MSLDNRANEHSSGLLLLRFPFVCPCNLYIFFYMEHILCCWDICSFICTYQIDYTFWPAILNLFCVVCCLKWKINKKAECVEQTTRNRETETNNWLCVFRTKSQSSIYFVRLLFLLCSLFHCFFRFVLNFIRFYLVEITCKTHFIRMFLKVSSSSCHLRNPCV